MWKCSLYNRRFDGYCCSPGILGAYLDSGAFNGGTKATFSYFVAPADQQTVLVCVTLEDSQRIINLLEEVYCNGNGFGLSQD